MYNLLQYQAIPNVGQSRSLMVLPMEQCQLWIHFRAGWLCATTNRLNFVLYCDKERKVSPWDGGYMKKILDIWKDSLPGSEQFLFYHSVTLYWNSMWLCNTQDSKERGKHINIALPYKCLSLQFNSHVQMFVLFSLCSVNVTTGFKIVNCWQGCEIGKWW